MDYDKNLASDSARRVSKVLVIPFSEEILYREKIHHKWVTQVFAFLHRSKKKLLQRSEIKPSFQIYFTQTILHQCLKKFSLQQYHTIFQICRPDYRKARKLFASEGKFKIQTCWIVAPFLANKPVNFASLTDSFISLFSKLSKLWM